MPKITLIAAVSNNGCIGKNNKIPWYIPEDFTFFKNNTLGKSIIMGRKTWESLPKRPLPDRENIVISKQGNIEIEGAIVFNCLTDAINYCDQKSEVVIIGGAEIYKQTIELATDLRITKVDLIVEGDTFFPKIDTTLWKENTRENHTSKTNVNYQFIHYTKNKD